VTNILNIPLLDGANSSFTISNNAAWTDSIYFGAPGFGPPFTLAGCSIVTGSNIVTIPTLSSTSVLSPGMQVSGTPGIPSASYVGNIPSLTTFTLVDGTGNTLNATANSIEITITFNPPPLDLSGIGFVSNLRTAPGSAQVFLVAQTGDGTMVNGATAGTLSWNVPGARMQNVPAGIYVMGILAVDSTTRRELFPTAPATVTVIAGVSDINTLTGTFHP
jgi:hypothetical protein